jgi:protein-L-isoaspartate(D-aspartate) O-methyltransferase
MIFRVPAIDRNMPMNDNYGLIDEISISARFYLDGSERDANVLKAMMSVDRAAFLPVENVHMAYNDVPVPIGYGQTCSQPSMTAFMLDKLEIVPGNIILEIGAGCGYASAAASLLCKPDGKVFASEIIPELSGRLTHNLASYIDNINIIHGDGSSGFPEHAPFDRIFVSAGVNGDKFDPHILIDQLSSNGILLYPEVRGNLYRIKKSGNNTIRDTYYEVSFVPLKDANS